MPRLTIFSSFLLLLLSLPLWSLAQIEMPPIFSNHLVLQRELPIPVWGTASSDADVNNKHQSQ